MVAKIIDATEIRTGTNIFIEGQPFTVKKIDISKTGKHGHAKCRIEAAHMITESKKVFVVPGHERFEVPLVIKNKGQVLSIGEKVSVMNLENFETIEMDCPEELKSQLQENSNVEYWDIEGTLVIKRTL
jgi:translation initiation factor 5A